MKQNLSSKKRNTMWAELFSEYIFIVTPFVFLVAIKLYTSSWEDILLAPDWSLVSCIIFGQIAVRMSRSAIKYRTADDTQFGLYSAKRFFLVAMSLLFYFGMVAQPTIYLGWGQLVLFLMASYFHFKDGLAARILEGRVKI
ncbi:hypothetical protein IFT37_04955 [Pseudomonas fluorescens]|uniref:hypothetical protein n=1 Tax=Pseudomonas fluorescens TaxID=294 RepID=UPI001782B246|nr:hypothetical protein [Pseudomonas fluorescens]MBD8148451.1 hypothetical protein [Pseudomonas fluorescens]MBD8179055.1 hypothetical protein [Pseudomonas fluorescens]MBD8744445.1 hypothetical protein [Pseudomonas fluorescens]MBD8751443.1 hypothetical protein [Pseudomonas fluorescens]MBD8761825.1 hypothetical protein [Pseudomonas fluorescens]